MQLADIIKYVNISKSSILKIKSKLLIKIKRYYHINPILLGGPDKIVQIDETMLNHLVTAHSGRSPKNQSWALGIVDYSFKPAKGCLCLIKDKSSEQLLP